MCLGMGGVCVTRKGLREDECSTLSSKSSCHCRREVLGEWHEEMKPCIWWPGCSLQWPCQHPPPTSEWQTHTQRTRHRLTRHSDGLRVWSAPVSWRSSPVPLWQLAWSSSHSSTGFPLGVVGSAVGAETRAKHYFSHF